MPESLQSDYVADMIISTLKDLGRPNYNEIASDYQSYPGYIDLLRRKQKQVPGYGVNRQVMVGVPNNASRIGAYATMNLSAGDSLKTITVPRRLYASGYLVDEYLLAQNSGNEVQIVNELQKARNQGMMALAYLTEPDIWGVPTDTDDQDMIYGFKYWLVYNATTGFNGGHPSGFTSVGGLSSTTYTDWKNYTFQYTAVSEDDLLDKMRTACKKCNFMPPVAVPEYQGGGMDWSFYTTEAIHNAMLKSTRGQNQNLGLELYDFKGVPVFKSVPITWVPALDDTAVAAASSDPIYGVNWKTFEIDSLNGFNMSERGPIRPSDQPLVRAMFIFLSFNLICTNRRKNFIGAKAQP